MNYEAIEVYARAASEIEALKSTGEMKSSAGYLVGKLRKAIEMEAGREALREHYESILRGEQLVYSGELGRCKAYSGELREIDLDAWFQVVSKPKQTRKLTLEVYSCGSMSTHVLDRTDA